MTPAQAIERLERILELVEAALQVLAEVRTDAGAFARTALRVVMSETAVLKDEAAMANAFGKSTLPTDTPPKKGPKTKR